MGNPYDKLYTVPLDSPPIEFPAGSCKWHYPGDQIRMNAAEMSVCADLKGLPVGTPRDCFPVCRAGEGGYPTGGYRVPFNIPAGATDAVHIVPSLEGCAAPRMVCMDYCSACIYAGYDAAPLIDPEDPDAQAGGGGDPNPTCRVLDCVETIHFANPGAEDVLVTLSYFSTVA